MILVVMRGLQTHPLGCWSMKDPDRSSFCFIIHVRTCIGVFLSRVCFVPLGSNKFVMLLFVKFSSCTPAEVVAIAIAIM